MARSGRGGASLVGLLVILLVVVAATLLFIGQKPLISGFADLISCEQGRVPCPEGYFCQDTKCVPIYPAMDIETVNAY